MTLWLPFSFVKTTKGDINVIWIVLPAKCINRTDNKFFASFEQVTPRHLFKEVLGVYL